MKIHELVKHKRKQLGLTQRELAAALNISAATLSRIERAESPPTLATLFNLARVFSIPVNELIVAAGGLDTLAPPSKTETFGVAVNEFEFNILSALGVLDVDDQKKLLSYLNFLLSSEKYNE